MINYKIDFRRNSSDSCLFLQCGFVQEKIKEMLKIFSALLCIISSCSSYQFGSYEFLCDGSYFYIEIQIQIKQLSMRHRWQEK